MFVNDWSGQYGSHWHYPGTWVGHQQNPYYGFGMQPHNFYGLGGNTMPYLQHMGQHNTGWLQGQTWPHGMHNMHNTMTHPFHTGMQHQGFNYNYNTPYTNTYLGQGYTPFHGNLNNPFLGCR